MTESTTPATSADPPDNQGGGSIAPSEPVTGSTQSGAEPDYTIASDPPDNQGG